MKNFNENIEKRVESMFSVAGKNFTVAKNLLDSEVSPSAHTRGGDLIGGENGFQKGLREIIDTFEKSQPVRKIRASRRSITGWINSFPGRDPVQFESSIERDCAYQLMFDPRIDHILSQPLTITFPKNDNGDRSYTPDYLVEYRDRKSSAKAIIECKPSEYWLQHKEKLLPRYRYVSKWAKARDMRFVLLTDDIVQGVSLQNIKKLYPHRLIGLADTQTHPRLQPLILKALPGSNREVLERVEGLFPSRASAQTEILAMLANGAIWCDLNQRLDMDTELRRFDWSEPSGFLFDRGIEFDES